MSEERAQQFRRRQDLQDIGRAELERRLKYLLSAYAQLYPMPLRGFTVRFDDGVTLEPLAREKRL
jgi:hypothetical protein